MTRRPGLQRAALALLAAGLLAAAGACSPTEGEDGLFDPVATTNTDFNEPAFVPVGNNPITMDAADYDGDTFLDIVVVNLLDEDNEFNGSISLLTNDGTGSFSETRTAVGSQASTVFFGQLNGLGNLDIVVLVNDASNPRVWLCFDPGPACASTAQVSLPGIAARMELVDLTGGAAPDDLLLTTPNTNQIVALVNDGSGNFTTATTKTTNVPGRFASGEFGGDANLDVVTLHPSSNQVIVRSGDGAGGFTKLHTQAVLDNPVDVVRLDPNTGDTLDDVAVSIDLNQVVTVLVIQSGPAYSTKSVGVGVNPERLVAGDFDDEGPANDVLVMNRRQQYIATIQGTNADPPNFASRLVVLGRDPFAAAPGDFSGAGTTQDAVVLEKEKRAVSVMKSDGSGGFSRTVIGFSATPTFPLVPPINLSGSSKADLLLLQPFSDRVVILTNRNP